MLKIVYQTCCGIDVHKKFVVACIASTDSKGITTYKTSRFSTFTNGLRELKDWLLANACTYVCMESTGKYWIPVFNILDDSCKVGLVEPFDLQVKLISSVPGIREFSAISIISEIGVDMSVFSTSKHLCSWAGLTPTNNESARKKKSVRISRAGVYIKPLLVQCYGLFAMVFLLPHSYV